MANDIEMFRVKLFNEAKAEQRRIEAMRKRIRQYKATLKAIDGKGRWVRIRPFMSEPTLNKVYALKRPDVSEVTAATWTKDGWQFALWPIPHGTDLLMWVPSKARKKQQ